jgi:hypothetical protein
MHDDLLTLTYTHTLLNDLPLLRQLSFFLHCNVCCGRGILGDTFSTIHYGATVLSYSIVLGPQTLLSFLL